MAENSDLETVKIEIRALVTSCPFLCDLKTLLHEYKKTCGHALPLFGFNNPRDFVNSLKDTVECFGNPLNPSLKLVKSQKSVHIATMVDKQCFRKGRPKPARIIPETEISSLNLESSFKTHFSSAESSPPKEFLGETNKKQEDQLDEESSQFYINDGLKKKLQNLIKNHPKGIWCRDLPALFKDAYNFNLDYVEYGFNSIIDMISRCPDIAKCVRPCSEDWIVFDPEIAPSEEKKILNKWTNIIKVEQNLREMMSKFSDEGLPLEMFQEVYEILFKSKIDFELLDFKNLKDLLLKVGENFLQVCMVQNIEMVVPKKKSYLSASSSLKKVDLSITPDSDRFMELFPEEAVGPNEKISQMDLKTIFMEGEIFEAKVKEVSSPSSFYLSFQKFENKTKKFLMDLQLYYNDALKKMKMPDATIQPNQLCAAYYTPEASTFCPEKWYRGKILCVTPDDRVDVHLIDWGKTVRIKKHNIRFLLKAFAKFPISLVLGKLSGITTINGDSEWPLKIRRKFTEMVKGKDCQAKIININIEDSFLNVVLYDPLEGVNINKKLEADGLAKFKIEDMEKSKNKNTFTSIMSSNEDFEEKNEIGSHSQKEIFHKNNYQESEKKTYTLKCENDFERNANSSTNQDERQKNINLMAIQMLTSNPDMHEIALIKPELALRMSLELAQMRYKSSSDEIPTPNSTSDMTLTPTSRSRSNSCISPAHSPQEKYVPVPDNFFLKPRNFIEKIILINENIHLIKIKAKLYCLTEELLPALTIFKNGKFADRVLLHKKLNFNYIISSKEENPEILKTIERFCEILKKEKNKILKIHLLPLEDVVPYLDALGCHAEEKIAVFKTISNLIPEL